MKIVDAQRFMTQELERRGIFCSEEVDPDHSGFIGVENSIITTTRGSLEAKQCSTSPFWGSWLRRQLAGLGVTRGGKIFLSVSSSFPGLVYSSIAACESLGAEVVLCVSLGSSSWGANRPELNMSVMLDILRENGFMTTKPGLYTLGGKNENAENMPPEGREFLIESLKDKPLVIADSLQRIVDLKAELISGSRVVVNIGGNASFPGVYESRREIPSGVILPEEMTDCGNGLAGIALRSGIPVINLRNIMRLAKTFRW